MVTANAGKANAWTKWEEVEFGVEQFQLLG
jgi:hypothetical protein